jgi:hypothetical protein
VAEQRWMPPMLAMPGVNRAEDRIIRFEWRRLVLDWRMLMKSSPTAWLNAPV